MDQKKLTDLIKRNRSASLNAEETAKLEKIWQENGEGKSFLDDHTPSELQEIERKMFRSIKLGIVKKERLIYVPAQNNMVYYKAAAVALIFFSALLWWNSKSDSFKEIETGFGEHLTVTLPDQSTVVLNGNSVLKYSLDWDKKESREVWIEGEGFFAITHTKNHQKFIVHASNQLDVEVLGTKFNVKTRDEASEVMLAEGKVKLGLSKSSDTTKVFLKPGELAVLQNEQLSKRSVTQRQYTSWIENKLVFDHTSLGEVATILKETYGLNVMFSDSDLQEREISGEISAATADDILYAIAETFDLEVSKRGKSVRISLKHN